MAEVRRPGSGPFPGVCDRGRRPCVRSLPTSMNGERSPHRFSTESPDLELDGSGTGRGTLARGKRKEVARRAGGWVGRAPRTPETRCRLLGDVRGPFRVVAGRSPFSPYLNRGREAAKRSRGETVPRLGAGRRSVSRDGPEPRRRRSGAARPGSPASAGSGPAGWRSAAGGSARPTCAARGRRGPSRGPSPSASRRH